MLIAIYSLLFLMTVGSALMVVFSRHAVHSALWLVFTMIAIAGNFILINAQLAAVLQVLVYAGAIMVLFLFVIMLLNLGHMPEPTPATGAIRRWGVPLILALVVQLVILALRMGAASAPEVAAVGTRETAKVADVALYLLTRYLYAFEMTSVLLLVSVVGAMVLGRRSLSKGPAPNAES